MKKLICLIAAFLAVAGAQAADVIFPMTNWDLSTISATTNALRIRQVGDIQADGSYFYIGLPKWLTGTTNGLYTNKLAQGNYEALIQWPVGAVPAPKPILFQVPNDTNTWLLQQLQISGGNFFVTRIINTSTNAPQTPITNDVDYAGHVIFGVADITMNGSGGIGNSITGWQIDSGGNGVLGDIGSLANNYNIQNSDGSASFNGLVSSGTGFSGNGHLITAVAGGNITAGSVSSNALDTATKAQLFAGVSTNDSRALNLPNTNSQYAGVFTSYQLSLNPAGNGSVDTNMFQMYQRQYISAQSNSTSPVSMIFGTIFGAHDFGDGSEAIWNFNRAGIGGIGGSAPAIIQFGGLAAFDPSAMTFTRYAGGIGPGRRFARSNLIGFGYGYYTTGETDGQVDIGISQGDSLGHVTVTTWVGFPADEDNSDPEGETPRSVDVYQDVVLGKPIGQQVYGTSLLSVTQPSPGVATGFGINMGQRWQDVTMGANLTVGLTNFGITTNSGPGTIAGLETDVIFFPGTFTYTIAFSNGPVNLIWENEAGTAVAPTTVGPSKTLHLHILLDIAAGATNAHIRYAQGTYSPQIDPDANKLFTMLVTAGTVSSPQSNAINNWFISAKANNYFTNLIYFYGMFGTNTNQLSWNWVNTNTFRLAFHGTIVASNMLGTGFWGNGSDIWADTTMTPSVSMASMTNSMYGVYLRSTSQPTASAFYFGEIDNSGSSRRASMASLDSTHVNVGGLNVNQNNTQFMSFTVDASGFMGANLQGTSQDGYFKNALQNNATVTATGLPTSPIPLLGLWDRTSADSFMNAQIDIAVAGQFMTQAKMTAMMTNIIDLNTGLAR